MAEICCFICGKTFDLEQNDHICPHCGAYNISSSSGTAQTKSKTVQKDLCSVEQQQENKAETDKNLFDTVNPAVQEDVRPVSKEQKELEERIEQPFISKNNSVPKSDTCERITKSAASVQKPSFKKEMPKDETFDFIKYGEELKAAKKWKWKHILRVILISVVAIVLGSWIGKGIGMKTADQLYDSDLPVTIAEPNQEVTLCDYVTCKVEDYAIPVRISSKAPELLELGLRAYAVPYVQTRIPGKRLETRVISRCYARLPNGKCVKQEDPPIAILEENSVAMEAFYLGSYDPDEKLFCFILPEDTKEFTVCIVLEDMQDYPSVAIQRFEFPVTVDEEGDLSAW